MNLFDEVDAMPITKPAPSPAIAKTRTVTKSDVVVAIEANVLVFDIETGPIDEELIRRALPEFDPASLGNPPGEFDPSTVKLGNLKDQKKIADKIEKAREDHNDTITKWNAKASTAASDYWRTAMDKAALSPITGEVLAIGYGDAASEDVIIEDGGGNERAILEAFWDYFAANEARYTGWNIAGFDVWFLANRSRILGIPHPEVLDRSGRYLSTRFIDLMDLWNCGSRSFYDPLAGKNKTGAKAKDIARVLGVGRPSDATPVKHGGQFADFWRGTPEQKEQACEYLRWDIREETGIARVFGVL